MIISVIGGHSPPSRALLQAEQVGRLLAERDIIVVCGGLGGVMEAVCRGAKEANGTTIGILPGINPTEGNQWVDIPICTGIGFTRSAIVARTGAAVIAIDGSYGTLSEIGHALGDGIPVVGLDTWSLQPGDKTSQEPYEINAIVPVSTPEEAVEKAIELGKQRLENMTTLGN